MSTGLLTSLNFVFVKVKNKLDVIKYETIWRGNKYTLSVYTSTCIYCK